MGLRTSDYGSQDLRLWSQGLKDPYSGLQEPYSGLQEPFSGPQEKYSGPRSSIRGPRHRTYGVLGVGQNSHFWPNSQNRAKWPESGRTP